MHLPPAPRTTDPEPAEGPLPLVRWRGEEEPSRSNVRDWSSAALRPQCTREPGIGSSGTFEARSALAAAHLLASIPNEAPMEFVTGIEWRDEILQDPLEVVDGCLVVPDRPGLGIELDEGGVEKHRWKPGS